MKKTFYSECKRDKFVEIITIAFFNKKFIIELTGPTIGQTESLKVTICVLLRLYSRDSRQYFTIDGGQDGSIVKISGNIFNAFKMMRDQDIIKEELALLIEKDEEIQHIFELCKKFPENPSTKYMLCISPSIFESKSQENKDLKPTSENQSVILTNTKSMRD